MQQFSHDYTKVSEALESLYSATRLMANECYDAALQRINEARTILQQYLAQDNMVPDKDVSDGWIRYSEAAERTFTDEQLDFIRHLFAERLQRNWESALADDELAIINRCQARLGCPEFESVEHVRKQHIWYLGLDSTDGKDHS